VFRHVPLFTVSTAATLLPLRSPATPSRLRARFNIRRERSAQNLLLSPVRLAHPPLQTSEPFPISTLVGSGSKKTDDLSGLALVSLDQPRRGIHVDVRGDAQQARSIVVDLRESGISASRVPLSPSSGAMLPKRDVSSKLFLTRASIDAQILESYRDNLVDEESQCGPTRMMSDLRGKRSAPARCF